MASSERFELPTRSLGRSRSIQLSYEDGVKPLACLAALCIAVGPAAAACPPRGGFEVPAPRSVGADGIALPDGRVLKLAGIVVPDEAAIAAHEAMRRWLERGARAVPVADAADRWGRLRVSLIAPAGWIEERLVAEGLALAAPAPGELACQDALGAVEALAADEGRGLWSGAPVISAGDGAALAARAGAFVLVEGRVLSVGVRRNGTYLDFGRSWRRDFAVFVPAAARRAFVAEGVDLAALVGRTVRVRGVLDTGEPPRLRLEWPAGLIERPSRSTGR